MYYSLFEQVIVEDVYTTIYYGNNTISFLINNGGYAIDVEFHDGPYNVIKIWNYTGLIDTIHNNKGKCWTIKVIFSLYL
jgi:pyruvate decarboxylase